MHQPDVTFFSGVPVIDGQYHHLLDYISDLQRAHRQDDRVRVGEVLHHLLDYAKAHFSFEEQLMKSVGYGMLEAHKRVHEAFIANIHRILEQHRAGQDITRKLISELQIWLTNHVERDDMDYAPLLKRQQKKTRHGWRRLLTPFGGT